MKKSVFLLIIILVMIVNTVKSQSISDLLDGYCAYNRFWGSVLVSRNGEVIFRKDYGFADKESNKIINAESLFSLASVTKTLTTAAIFKLHQEGKLSIYDRVDKYLPGFINDKTDSLTIINLLNHTSGMIANLAQTDDFSKEHAVAQPGSEVTTLEQMIGTFRQTKLKSRPGTKFNYNNYGYALLACIIEKVTGMDYFSYLDKEIFPVAGMTSTCGQRFLTVQPAKGYTGLGTSQITPVHDAVFPLWLKGPVGLYSSASDLNRFLESLLSHRLLTGETLKLMLDTCISAGGKGMQWAAGWQKNELDGVNFYSHGGSIEGFSTRIGFVPEENISFVILSNLVKDKSNDGLSSVNFSWVDEIAEDIIRILHGKTVSCLPVPTGKARKETAGSYIFDNNHLMNISYNNDSLYLSMDKQCGFTLFDHNLYSEIKDTSAGYKICRLFASSMIRRDLNGLVRYANANMQKAVFNENFLASIVSFWDKLVSQAGECSSSSVYNKTEYPGCTAYSLVFHLNKAEVLMQLEFNESSLINGFFILKVFPKCNIATIRLIPAGRDEYFVDGYGYGGYKDFSVRFDNRARTVSFQSGDDNFTALRCRGKVKALCSEGSYSGVQ